MMTRLTARGDDDELPRRKQQMRNRGCKCVRRIAQKHLDTLISYRLNCVVFRHK
jgi:hypothetical protein